MTIESSLFIAVNEPADTVTPAYFEEIIADDEPAGEYFIYAASNREAVSNKPEGWDLLQERLKERGFPERFDRILSQSTSVLFTAKVSYSSFWLEQVRDDIEAQRQQTGVDTYDIYARSLSFDKLTMQAVTDQFPKIHNSLVREGIGDDWNATVKFSLNKGESSFIKFEFEQITSTRVLTVSALLKDSSLVIGDVHAHWKALVDKYRDMPDKEFSGAFIA